MSKGFFHRKWWFHNTTKEVLELDPILANALTYWLALRCMCSIYLLGCTTLNASNSIVPKISQQAWGPLGKILAGISQRLFQFERLGSITINTTKKIIVKNTRRQLHDNKVMLETHPSPHLIPRHIYMSTLNWILVFLNKCGRLV